MKGKTHVYFANLIINDLVRTGKLTLPQYGDFTPPDDVIRAILDHPAAFRAGSVGPDFYPDMLLGQSVIHAEHSGTWLTLLFNEYGRLPVAHPERLKCYAFILGFMLHYAADMFGHHYVNSWSRGWFELAPDAEKIKIMLRHILVETYIDRKVPAGNCADLDAPIWFLRDVFTATIARQRCATAASTLPQPLMLMTNLYQSIEGVRGMKEVSPFDAVNYFPGWSEDIRNATHAWIETWQRVAHILAGNEHSVKDAYQALQCWKDTYLAEMLGVPHWAHVIIDFLQSVIKAIDPLRPVETLIRQLLTDYLSRMISTLTNKNVSSLDEAIGLLGEMLKDPGFYLNNGTLFPEFIMTRILDTEMGNFGRSDDTTKQSFDAALQCLNMSKLCLIGPANLNGLMTQLTAGYVGRRRPQVSPVSFAYAPYQVARGVRRLTIRFRTQTNNYNPFSSQPSTCGTDDCVYFGLVLDDGTVYETILDTPFHNDFENGNEDEFVFELPVSVALDRIRSVRLRKDYIALSDDWKPSWLRLFDETGERLAEIPISSMLTGRTNYTFPVSIVREHPPVSIDPSIISFLYSLDGAGPDKKNPTEYLQWNSDKFPWYTNSALRATAFKTLFETHCDVPDPLAEQRTGIRFMAAGKYFCAEGGGGREVNATRTAGTAWETFLVSGTGLILLRSGNAISLQSALGNFLTTRTGRLEAIDPCDGLHERFIIRSTETVTPIRRRGPGMVQKIVSGSRITLRTEGGKYLCVRPDGSICAEVAPNPETYLFTVELTTVTISNPALSATHDIGRLTGWAGFDYDENQRILYSRVDAWQRNGGYFTLYDMASPAALMFIHCEPVRFRYDNRNWKIEFWKGQYGICTGAEIGIYTGEFQVESGNPAIDHTLNQIRFGGDTQCAGDADMLQMSFVLYKAGREVLRRDSDAAGTATVEKHWWLTGFRPFAFSLPSSLEMRATIVFKDCAMAEAFIGGLLVLKYDAAGIVHAAGSPTVSFTYARPRTQQYLPL